MLETVVETNEIQELRNESQELREENERLRGQVQRLEQEVNKWQFKYYSIEDWVRSLVNSGNNFLNESHFKNNWQEHLD